MSAATPPVIPAIPRSRWSARLFSLPVVLGLGLVYLLFFFTSHTGVADPDIWWHLRNASQLIHTRHFTRTEGWTFTVAGKPWINFEWLAELPYYFAYQWLGYSGLYLVMMVVAGAIVAGIYYLAWMRSGDWTAAFLASLPGVLFATVSLAPRTLLFGWLLLVIELAVLWNFSRGRDSTAWLPLLFLLWINAHGSWLIGLVLLAVFVGCGLTEGTWGLVYATRWSRSQARKLLTVLGASFAVLFINPYGGRLVAYPFDVMFQQKQTLRLVAEWASLDFHTVRGKTVLATFLLLGVLQLIRRRRWALQDLAFALIAVYGAVTYVRFVFLAGILLPPLLAMSLVENRVKTARPVKDQRAGAAVALVALVAAIGWLYPSEKQLASGVAQSFPEKALPYVRSLAGQRHLFNEFLWGGYLEWQAPQVQEFIDSRVDIFAHEGVLDDYVRATHAQDTFAVLDRYQIRWVLLAKDNPALYVLENSPDWKRTYDDGMAVGLERVR